MKYHILSDIHLEFFDDPKEAALLLGSWAQNADCLILAGDICVMKYWADFVPVIKSLTEAYPMTLYVPGNHEFYRSSFNETADNLKKFEAAFGGKLQVLYNKVVTVGGQTIIGGTFWVPESPDSILQTAGMSGISDYQVIMNFRNEVHKEHAKAVKLFTKTKQYDIAVTHFAVHPGSIHENFRNHPLNWFFSSNQIPLIRLRQPKVFVHGHVHNAFDYNEGTTRIVCNPFGYSGEIGKNGFRKDLVVEL
jgi:predicted phosphodiesterase